MLERLKLIFTKSEPETVAGLKAARGELEAARAEAVAKLQAVQGEKNAALVEAIAADDDKERARLRKSLAAAQAEVDEISGALAGLDARIAAATAAENATDLQRRLHKTADLLEQREQMASKMQMLVKELAVTFQKMDALRAEAIAMHPNGRNRARTMGEFSQTDQALAAAIGRHMLVASGGLIGDPQCLGVFTLGEMRQRLESIPETVARSNRQFLGSTNEEARHAEPAAA